MEMLEREGSLENLGDALKEAAAGEGRIALISGEAGIGKTSLVQRFLKDQGTSACILFGECDALFTPSPLGPLHDMALQLRGPLLDLMSQQVDRLAIFTAFLKILQDSQLPIVIAIEDVHWADEATLDLIKFLGRRIQQIRCLLIITYRDDELMAGHPLWFVLGDLPSRAIRRLRLFPLSQSAVTRLAHGSGRNVADLYAVTGGNPFFVSEILSDHNATIPRSVREAVLARAARLAAPARELLDLASVMPTRADRRLLDAVLAPSLKTLEACASTGLVRLKSDSMVFRHELARQAISEAMPLPRARRWHRLVLEVLLGWEDPPLARVVHHARFAEDEDVVREFAPLAAARSSTLGAHRAAASYYDAAVEYAGAIPAEDQAELLEKRSYEYYLTSQITLSASDRQTALRLRQELRQPLKEGENLRWLSRLAWVQGRGEAAEQYADRAIAVLESLPPGPELAMAYSNRSQLYSTTAQTAAAVTLGGRASDLAEQLGATDILVHAMQNVGAARWQTRDASGRVQLEENLQMALANDLQEHASRAYAILGSISVMLRDFEHALPYLNTGIAYCDDRDLETHGLYMRGWRAQANLELGNWSRVAEDANLVLNSCREVAVFRIPSLTALGLLYVRRGDRGYGELLDEARDLAEETGELQRLAPVAAARAESFWWSGRRRQIATELRKVFELALRQNQLWAVGELGYWLWRAEAVTNIPSKAAEPYLLQMNGKWRAAAAAWSGLGCPYQQALALSDGDATAQKAALAILDRLTAVPAAEAVRRKLRVEGVRGIPRGPRSDTLENPGRLTTRQWEVLSLLVRDMSNHEIAQYLHISPKTVGHHVSAILGKLKVQSRQGAALVAVRRGWFAADP